MSLRDLLRLRRRAQPTPPTRVVRTAPGAPPGATTISSMPDPTPRGLLSTAIAAEMINSRPVDEPPKPDRTTGETTVDIEPKYDTAPATEPSAPFYTPPTYEHSYTPPSYSPPSSSYTPPSYDSSSSSSYSSGSSSSYSSGSSSSSYDSGSSGSFDSGSF